MQNHMRRGHTNAQPVKKSRSSPYPQSRPTQKTRKSSEQVVSASAPQTQQASDLSIILTLQI